MAASSTRSLAASQEPGSSLGVLLPLVLALGIAFPYFEQTRNANERPRLMQGIALAEQGSFFIDGVRDMDAGPDVARARDGHLVPNKPPGVSLVAAGAFAAAKAAHGESLTLRQYTGWTRWFSGILPTIALAAWLLSRLRRVYGFATARAATWLTVFATPLASYAHLAYGHALAAALLLVGVGQLIDLATSHGGGPGIAPSRPGAPVLRAFAGGVLAASAIAVEYAAAFAGPSVALLLLVRARTIGPAAFAAAILGAVLPIAGLLAYHRAVFGSAFATGYHHVVDAGFAAKHGQGFLGLRGPTIDSFMTHVLAPDAGLLWWAPLVGFALFGLVLGLRLRRQPERTQGWVGLAIVSTFIVLSVSLSFDGGWRVGPRYLVAALPFLAWGLAEMLTRARALPLWFGLFAALAVYGTVVNVLAANFWPHFDTAPITHPLPDVLLPLWRESVEPYHLGSSSTASGWLPWSLVHVTSIATVLVGWWWLGRTIERQTRMLVSWLASGVCGLALVAATQRLPQLPVSERNLAYILRVWEPRPDREAISIPLAEPAARRQRDGFAR